ncbi:MAG: histidine phosphatase family protein [Thermoguttaceae bacterium]|nr:histidine phosphatase family protein [Thermoguttaceae bacterium]MDW8038503.1 histidine phosphatase family protein [Thermoguttaceae bacterium]
MLRIILIHPGATSYTPEGRIQGNLDLPLSEQGQMEVAHLAEMLRNQGIQLLYAPQSEPAWETAQRLASLLGLKVKKLERMENLNYGLWQGMAIEEVRHKQPKVYRQWQEQPEIVCPPEGEMLAEADARAQAAVARLVKKHPEGVIGLVLPEPLASLVRRALTGQPLGDLWKVLEMHGNFEILEVDTKSPTISRA